MLTLLEKINGKGLNLTTLFAVIGLIVQQVRWQAKTEARLETLETHASDTEKHTSYRENSVLFVPRAEIQIKLSNIEKMVEKIDKKLDAK